MKSVFRTGRKSPSLALELLESRVPMCAAAVAVQPTVSLSIHEQQMLELINRTRANPAAEASREGISLNQGLDAGTLAAHARQPLAPNDLLGNVANAHTRDMINRRYFSHQNPDGLWPGQRTEAAGYYSTYVGENLSAKGLIGLSSAAHTLHSNLFNSSGHRVNMLLDGYREIGVGLQYGSIRFSNGNTQTGSIVTQLFGGGYSGKMYLTGVGYQDTVGNNFYDAGEGRSGITVEARDRDGNRYSTTTGTSGGYSLRLDAGTYQILAYSANRTRVLDLGRVTLSNANVKQDVDAGQLQGGLPVAEIVLAGSGESLSMSDPEFNVIDLCRVDIRGTGDNTLLVDAEKLSQVFDQRVITVIADTGDSVVFDSQWHVESTRIEAGRLVRRLRHDSAMLDLIGPTDFTNPIDSFDVNSTGHVSATDALVIVNELAARRFSLSTDGAALGADAVDLGELSYFDVSADGYVTSLDALRVINEMTRRSNTAIALGEQSSAEWGGVEFAGLQQTAIRGEATEGSRERDDLSQLALSRLSELHSAAEWQQPSSGHQEPLSRHEASSLPVNSSLPAKRVDLALLQLGNEFESGTAGLAANL